MCLPINGILKTRNLRILYLVCLAVSGDSLWNRWRRRGLVKVRAVVIQQQLITQRVQFCKEFICIVNR